MSWIFWVLPLTFKRNLREILEQFTTYQLLNTLITFSFPFFSSALLQFPEPRTPPQSPQSWPRRFLGLEVRGLLIQVREKGLWKHEEVRACLNRQRRELCFTF